MSKLQECWQVISVPWHARYWQVDKVHVHFFAGTLRTHQERVVWSFHYPASAASASLSDNGGSGGRWLQEMTASRRMDTAKTREGENFLLVMEVQYPWTTRMTSFSSIVTSSGGGFGQSNSGFGHTGRETGAACPLAGRSKLPIGFHGVMVRWNNEYGSMIIMESNYNDMAK